MQNVVPVYRSVFNLLDKSQKYYEAEAEAIQQPKGGCRGDFKFDCKETKKVLSLNSFWEELANIFPKFGKNPDGMCIAHPLLNNGCPLPDRIQRYFKLMHLLGQQIVYWKPEAVSMRDSYALEAHRLYGLLGLSARQYGPGLHIFLFHPTPRILDSGNLVEVSEEGGKRMHQPHSRITERTPTYWFSRCPPGILDCITWGARVLSLWFLPEEVPYKHFGPLTLPSFYRESACVGPYPLLAITIYASDWRGVRRPGAGQEERQGTAAQLAFGRGPYCRHMCTPR